MPLRSELFRGDQKLEAAAVSDPAHVAPGARGEHVRKVQLALARLDGATLVPDGVYGPATAAAVLAYKQKRGIINRQYQTLADNVVGKMTVAALDAELERLENPKPIQLRVLSPSPDVLNHRPRVTLARSGQSASGFSLAPAYAGPGFSTGPLVSINKGQSALVEVREGLSAFVVEGDPAIATVRDPKNPSVPLTRITSDPQTIEIVGLQHGGAAFFFVYGGPGGLLGLPSVNQVALYINVRDLARTPYVATMTPHNHQPCKRWWKLLKDIEQPTDSFAGKALWSLCAAGAPPQAFVDAAVLGEFRDKPAALKHLNWYLREGKGRDFNEDKNIEQWVHSDSKIRNRVKTEIQQRPFTPHLHLAFWFDSGEYENQDFKYCFGSIDRLDVQVDWVLGTVKLFFMDSYEWHPYCPGYYSIFSDDNVRITNSLHAALVELKDNGAADFWMVGEATFPLRVFGL